MATEKQIAAAKAWRLSRDESPSTLQSSRNSNTIEDEEELISARDIALESKKKEAYNEELKRPVLSASFGDASDSSLLINKEDLTDE